MASFPLNPFFHFAVSHRNCICIAYCVTENQLENVGYSIISIINRTNASLHVFIYTPTLFEKTNSIFYILERKYPNRIEFFFDTIDFELCKRVFHNQWNFWNPFSNARIFMIEKIPVSRCIYLDSDVYGCGDIQELWNIDLKNNLIGAVLDRLPFYQSIGPDHLKILNSLMDKSEIELMNNTGLTVDDYFNSGVLYLNIAQMTKVNFTQRCVQSYLKNQTFYADQDLLNMFAGHRRLILDFKFNKMLFGNYAKCVLRHYNKKKVTHPVVVRHHEDYDYYFDAVDEYNRLLPKVNDTTHS